jgi:phosphopantetheinyl transferase
VLGIDFDQWGVVYREVPCGLEKTRVAVFIGQPDAAEIESLAVCLTSDEWARAKGFATRQLQQWYLWRRSLLRHVLADQSGQAAEMIRFAYGKHGKPTWDVAMGSDGDAIPWQFNLSHTQGAVAIAMTCRGSIGVDIEAEREIEPLESVARMVLSERELANWLPFASSQRLATMRRVWVIKEAIIKAWGVGLSYSPAEICLGKVWRELATGQPVCGQVPAMRGSYAWGDGANGGFTNGAVDFQFFTGPSPFSLAVAISDPLSTSGLLGG